MSRKFFIPHLSVQENISSTTVDAIFAERLDEVAKNYIASLSQETLKSFNGRLERGLELAKNGAVMPLNHPKHPRRLQVQASDGSKVYQVDLEAKTCDCPDSQKGHTCKHRIAAYYYEQASQPPAKPQPPSEDENKKRVDELLRKLGFDSEEVVARPVSLRLGMLYRRYLHGSDLNGKPVPVVIKSITREEVKPHPSLPAEGKWCLWVNGLPEGMPDGVLFGATGEQDLIAIFGQVEIQNLKGKSILLVPRAMNVAGQEKIVIRFERPS